MHFLINFSWRTPGPPGRTIYAKTEKMLYFSSDSSLNNKYFFHAFCKFNSEHVQMLRTTECSTVQKLGE